MFRRAEKYGIRFVIDLHSPPGGRGEDRNMTMFFDKKYADHFVNVWERIAKRFRGNPSVWAYDLVNEPFQTRPAKYDYWNIQRMAAEAVRRIDPDTPIMIESNDWDSAPTYSYLSPLAMDQCDLSGSYVRSGPVHAPVCPQCLRGTGQQGPTSSNIPA